MKLDIGIELISKRQIYYSSINSNGATGQQWINSGEKIVVEKVEMHPSDDKYYFSRPEWKLKYGNEEGMWVGENNIDWINENFYETHSSIQLCNY